MLIFPKNGSEGGRVEVEPQPPKEKPFVWSHKPGKPRKLKPETLDEMWEYLLTYKETEEVIPTIEGLSVRMMVGASTIYKWEDECRSEDIPEDFPLSKSQRQQYLEMLNMLRALQAKELQNKALSGKFNAKVAIRLLAADHGKVERSDVTSGGESLGLAESIIEGLKEAASQDDE